MYCYLLVFLSCLWINGFWNMGLWMCKPQGRTRVGCEWGVGAVCLGCRQQKGSLSVENFKTIIKLPRCQSAFFLSPCTRNSVSDKILLPGKKKNLSCYILITTLWLLLSFNNMYMSFKWVWFCYLSFQKYCALYGSSFQELSCIQSSGNTQDPATLFILRVSL